MDTPAGCRARIGGPQLDWGPEREYGHGVESYSLKEVAMDSLRFTRDQLAFLIGVPLAWAVLLLFHPTGEGEAITYGDVQDQLTRWLVVHLGMVVFIPLIAGVVYVLVRGMQSTAARVCRIALLFFVVFYGAFEVLVGIGTGILVDGINGLAAGDKAAAAPLVEDFTDNILIRGPLGVFTSIGSVAFITATIAAGIALRREAAAPLAVTLLLGLSGFLITAHPPPYGPAGLALFIVAILLLARSRAAGAARTRLTQPGPA
jgi:hypothetical protein